MKHTIDNRYQIIKELGSGLSGEVLLVEDSEGPKALKFLKRVQLGVSRQEALINFKNEFSILTELNHPGIARILDFGYDSKLMKYYFTSEMIAGVDFQKATEGKSIEEIEELAVQVLRALNYLHSRGIYHLDIKPQNILVESRGDRPVAPTAKIIDFGLSGLTSSQKRVGTPAYMAPEINLGGTLDGRTDLYSFGVVLYKAFARDNPFASKDLKETIKNHQTLIPPPPSEINPQIPNYWDRVIARLLQKSPSERYPQASFVIRDINFLGHKNYEIETMGTRLSYIPEKGTLVGRRKEVEIFKTLFETIFTEELPTASRLLIVEGKTGTGKSRLLREFKYHSQLHHVPTVNWKEFKEKETNPPYLILIDEGEDPSANHINLLLQKAAKKKILIIWATESAPIGWSNCEQVTLKNFSESELTDYLVMLTGLVNPPPKLVREIFRRTDGNPLFVTELVKTLLADNLLLDSMGRWASSTFEDIQIDFERIHVPTNVSGLLFDRYSKMSPDEKKILEWMAVFNQPISLETIQEVIQIERPQACLLNLTREDLIERTLRERDYFFKNILMREVLYKNLSKEDLQDRHHTIAQSLKDQSGREEDYLFHKGHGSDDKIAVETLLSLGERYLKKENYLSAVKILEETWDRAQKGNKNTQISAETKLAEAYVMARDYQKAVSHYLHLKSILSKLPSIQNASEKRITIYEKLGDLYAKLDQYKKALDLFKTALNWVNQSANNRVGRMLIQNHIANVYMKSGRIDEAEQIFKTNYKEWEKNFNLEEKKQVTNNLLADVLLIKQKYNEALDQIEKSISFFQQIQNQYLLARTYYVRGDLFYKKMLNAAGSERTGNKQKAVASFEKCHRIAKSINTFDMMLRSYNGIANLYYHEKEYQKSGEYYERALALARKQEDFQSAAAISFNLGTIYKIEKNFSDAYSHLVFAINTLENIEPKDYYTWLYLLNALVEIAEMYRETGEVDKAGKALDQAQNILQDQPALAPYQFYVYLELAKNYHKQNKETLFREFFKKARQKAKKKPEIEALQEFEKSIVRKEQPEKKIKEIKKAKVERKTEPGLEKKLRGILNHALELSGTKTGTLLLFNDSGEPIILIQGPLKVKSLARTQGQIDSYNNFDPNKTWKDYEAVIIAKCLEANRFKKTATARMLGISPATLYKKIGVFKLDQKENPLYEDSFVYQKGKTLKSYIPLIFKAAYEYENQHPYAAIKRLGVSQGYFYKVVKQPNSILSNQNPKIAST